MKINSTVLPVMALALALSAMTVSAQDNGQPNPDQQPPHPPRGFRQQQGDNGGSNGPGEGGQRPPRGQGQRPGGQPQDGEKPPVPPLIAALDANHDGVIDEQEIANASKALKSLDKNGDGKLTMDELRPARAMHPPQDGQGGPGNANGPRPPRGQGFNRGGGGPDDGGDRPARRGPPPQQGEQ